MSIPDSAGGAKDTVLTSRSQVHKTRISSVREVYTILIMLLFAGRKHQLRKACANVLQAPILGDGRYGLLRSPEQQWFQAHLQARNPALVSAVQTHDLRTLIVAAHMQAQGPQHIPIGIKAGRDLMQPQRQHRSHIFDMPLARGEIGVCNRAV